MKDFYFLTNNLFTSYTLKVDFPRIYNFTQDLSEVFAEISSIYDEKVFAGLQEHQLEDDFISKILEILGWSFVRQDEKMIQGKIEKPDFLLFSHASDKQAYQAIPKRERSSSNSHIAVILESKSYNVPIDNKKVKDNPHFQLLRYLSNLKLDFGFLTNGRMWRFYDNSKLTAQKIFYEIDLEAIIKRQDLHAFAYFYHIFKSENFRSNATEKHTQDSKTTQELTQMSHTLSANAQAKISIEDDLRSIIYGINGKESLFEKVGSCIYAKNPDAKLEDIYQSALYFVFRLLFIAYFEDKFEGILENHLYFKDEISLFTLLHKLKETQSHSRGKSRKTYRGIGKLEDIFRIYNEGKPHYDMPIFNGGLFDEANIPLLREPKIFDDDDLIAILDALLNYEDSSGECFKRDYRTLSVAHLGTIYEGLLSYFFAIAQEDLYYVIYEPRSASAKGSKSSSTKSLKSLKSIEGYFDSYDYAKIDQESIIHSASSYKKGQIYLKNTGNSRKSSASFYTPSSITKFLTKSALADKLSDSNILSFKILDNACGSGHFLVEALNCITSIIINDFDSFPTLKKIYEEEKRSIDANICNFLEDYIVDESDILKRLLLKRTLFGIDLNPFSIELTKLSLWIDSFIFGTPLSFLEHHIKCGNALIGTNIAEFKRFFQSSKDNLFIQESLQEDFKTLQVALQEITSLKDTTEEQIKSSKSLYRHSVLPKLTRLNLYLNFLTSLDFATGEDRIFLEDFGSKGGIEAVYHNERACELISELSCKYRFFNYEIEFPEILCDGEFVGFQVIIGNPPWDKSEFSDADFFPQYQSNYRTLSNSKKREISLNLLEKPYIKEEYDSQKAYTGVITQYYKSHYPLNRAGKDINLFRLFVEKNLTLLSPLGTLNYVLPSALMLEEGSYSLRKEILEKKTLQYFYSFENREGIFPDVDSRYKFALMQVQNAQADKDHTIKAMFYKTSIEQITQESPICLSLQEISTMSPTQLALQEVRKSEDLEILRKCYEAFAPLCTEWLDFRQDLNMTADKDLFIESYAKDLLPLYEGKMIHQFDSEFAEAQYFLDRYSLEERLRSKEIYRLKQDLGINTKYYEEILLAHRGELKAREFEDTFILYEYAFVRLGFRAVARDTDERTAIFSLIPPHCGFGHSMFASVSKRYTWDEAGGITHTRTSPLRLLFALGIFNSLVVDFIVRGMVQINLSKTYLERLPLPQPSDAEILESKLYTSIALDALRLQLFGSKESEWLKSLTQEISTIASPITPPATQKAYDTLRASLDIRIAKLYGLSKKEFFHLLESFRVLQSKQPTMISLLKAMWE